MHLSPFRAGLIEKAGQWKWGAARGMKTEEASVCPLSGSKGSRRLLPLRGTDSRIGVTLLKRFFATDSSHGKALQQQASKRIWDKFIYRLRCRAGGISRIFRYLVTVLLATFCPCDFKPRTSCSSFNGLALSSSATNFKINLATSLVDESRLKPDSQNPSRKGQRPWGISTIFSETALETVVTCKPTSSAIACILIGTRSSSLPLTTNRC